MRAMKIKKLAVIGISLLFTSASAIFETKIHHGEPADPGWFPFYTALNTVGDDISWQSCGGVIINERWVLTAPHCIKSSIMKFISVNEIESSISTIGG